MTTRPSFLGPLLTLAGMLLLTVGCVGLTADGVTLSYPASSTRVTALEDAFLKYAEDGKAANEAIRADFRAALEKYGQDPQGALADLDAAFVKAVEDLKKSVLEAAGEVQRGRESDSEWLYAILGALGLGGTYFGGSVAGKRKAQKSLSAPAKTEPKA